MAFEVHIRSVLRQSLAAGGAIAALIVFLTPQGSLADPFEGFLGTNSGNLDFNVQIPANSSSTFQASTIAAVEANGAKNVQNVSKPNGTIFGLVKYLGTFTKNVPYVEPADNDPVLATVSSPNGDIVANAMSPGATVVGGDFSLSGNS